MKVAPKKKLKEVASSRYWRREDAEVIIAAWRDSGETMAGFAREWSLKVDRVARWVARLEDSEGESEPEVLFHSVRVVEPAPAPPTHELEEPAASWVGDVRHGEFVVRVPLGFAADEMTRLLAVVAGVQPC